jgi:hypothetical protein
LACNLPLIVWEGKHWEYANLVELNQESKAYAQLDERGSWFYEAIGNSAGMQGRTLGYGQVYLNASFVRPLMRRFIAQAVCTSVQLHK